MSGPRNLYHLAVLLMVALGLFGSGCVPERDLPGQGRDEGKTVVYRDTWGVPHIYAPTASAGLYAVGWSQAEDRPEQLLENLLLGLGEYTRVAGAEALKQDLTTHLWDHHGVAKERYQTLRPEVREHLEAFARGINDFYASHPEDVPPWWGDRLVEPAMLVAFLRFFLYSWSIDDALGDLRRGGIEPGLTPSTRHSNQFAISPARSAEGAAILAIDPHLPWRGPSRFWEFRIHAGDLHGSGVTLPGVPYLGLGHTRHLAWAMTTGGPDTADVYALEIRMGIPPRYVYDGEWKNMTSREVVLEVKGRGPQRHTLWYSHHGPIVGWGEEGRAYAARISYADVVGAHEAFYELNFGADYRGAVRALSSLTLFPQNVMVADTSGNIYYQRTGRVPIRPDGYDWTKPVDGSTSATKWQGFHPASDHLQVLNPPQGYMQNCNVPPHAMMVDSLFSPEQTKGYLYSERGARPGRPNQRGARALELLSRDESVSLDEAMAYVNDLTPFGAARWVEALRLADEKFGRNHEEHRHYRRGVEDILSWDLQMAADSRGALKYDYWRHELREDLGREGVRDIAAGIEDRAAVVRGAAPSPIEVADHNLENLAQAFAAAMDKLVANHESLDATYGDRYRVGRGDRSWPVGGGGGSETACATLRSMSYGLEREDKTRWGVGGQTSTQIVLMTDPPQSWIVLPLGQSDRPESSHYRDQAEKLFSLRKMKPSWWLPEDLAGHIESRTELAGASGP